MEVLAFSVFTYISVMGRQTGRSLKVKTSASHYSKLDRKLSTICFSLASDASEIFPSALRDKKKVDYRSLNCKNCWNSQSNDLKEAKAEGSHLIAASRSWCWLRMCCRKAFSNFVILLGSILSR